MSPPLAAILTVAAALLAALVLRLARRPPLVATAVIVSPENHTEMDADGAVRSTQSADLTLPDAELDAIWSPMHLERLACTYWRFLARVTLGTIRVAYTPQERCVVFLTRPFVLLRFRAPEYAMDGARGAVRWRIARGLLVSRRGHDRDGYLQIDVRRRPAAQPGHSVAHVEVEVANFYPAIASGLGNAVYRATQSRIHVIVTHAFLRSLARLDLARSRVGRFADAIDEVVDPPLPAPERAGRAPQP